MTWEVRVAAGEAGRSHLSARTRFAATDEVTHARLLAAWPLLAPLAEALSRRKLAAVKAYAEERAELAG